MNPAAKAITIALLLILELLTAPRVRAASFDVMGSDGKPVRNFRWLIEEDTTPRTAPAASGHAANTTAAIQVNLNPDKRYLLTVMPDADYSLGGVALSPGQVQARVAVNRMPLPSAQLSVFVFEDLCPLDGRPDLPQERGLSGFKVTLHDAAGRMMMDAFGHPLGTVYDKYGQVMTQGQGFLTTVRGGEVIIKNLLPGSYAVIVTPPQGEDRWVQTTTLQGGKALEARIKAGEPKYAYESSLSGHHVAVGFARPLNDAKVLAGRAAIRGRVVSGDPSDSGAPLPGAWVALGEAAGGRTLFVAPCDAADGAFAIPNVPPGDYRITFWDEDLAFTLTARDITVSSQGLDLGSVPLPGWFARLRQRVFFDKNENGRPDPGEPGIPGQAVSLRRPDGTLVQSGVTDSSGNFDFTRLSPSLGWLVAEAGTTRLKSTAPAPTQSFEPLRGRAALIEWGKSTFADASTGGIAGVVVYATTRAEDDPRDAVADPWEPGVPRVPLNLYADANADGVIDDLNGDARATLADVDHAPFAWAQAPFTKGGEDLDRNGNGKFDYGDAINVVATAGGDDTSRTGAFNGHYAFTASSPLSRDGLPAGTYIVEAVPPPGFQIVKEEDKNVAFGEAFSLKPLSLVSSPPSVGDPHRVPATLSLFPGVPCKFAGQTRPLADRKQISLDHGQSARCDFHVFTPVPLAGRLAGKIHDELAGEGSDLPTFPISIRDFSGREISRLYSDPSGAFSALLPSTYHNNAPTPSGLSPGMFTLVVNAPGPILDAHAGSPTFGRMITDPFYDPRYGQSSHAIQSTPGVTTDLDLAIMRISASPGPGQPPPDLEFPSGTPIIHSVSGPAGGPYVSASGQALTIASLGKIGVPNPLYTSGGNQPKTIQRDYGFGSSPGKVTLGGVPLANVAWSDSSIRATVPPGAKTGQLKITRANGKSTPLGVTVTVGPIAGTVRHAFPSTDPLAHPLQDAIDLARPGDLVLVAPGRYDECVILWKPLQLQGWGAASTIISAASISPEKLQAWRDKVTSLFASGAIDLLPGQEAGFTSSSPAPLASEEGSALLVLARNAPPSQGGFGINPRPRIDGLTVTGAPLGGGIVVNGYARYLEISNNIVTANQGVFGGGIRAGNPVLTLETGAGPDYVNCETPGLYIHHNQVKGNTGRSGPGGVALYTGCDGYLVAYNWIVGNVAAGSGGGIGHRGLSHGGRIVANRLLFNQSLQQAGGIAIAGAAPLSLGALSPGAGAVKITANWIQDNQAASGEGGGIALDAINGRDVDANPGALDDPRRHDDLSGPAPGNVWFWVDLVNNIITGNRAGRAGGALALHDAASVAIIHNTIAGNESATAAGIASRAHSAALRAAFSVSSGVTPCSQFSNPRLVNNIIWQNRASDASLSDLAVLGLSGARLNPLTCLLTDKTGYHASNLTADPGFVSTHDHRLKPGAFAIGRGSASVLGLLGDLQFDVDGQPRPNGVVDLGADEHYAAWGRNAAPYARNDQFTIKSGQSLTIAAPGVLANDLDADNAPLQAALTRAPAKGLALLNPNGSFTYSPQAGAGGSDSFVYKASDGQAQSNGGTVCIRITQAGNTPPSASADHYQIAPGRVLTVNPNSGVLNNDRDPDGDTFFARLDQLPSHGALQFRADGSFSYTPSPGFTGTDIFKYLACDAGADAAATVTIAVTNPFAPNNPPRPTAAAIVTPMGAAVSIRILPNDPDPANTFSYSLILPPAFGAATLSPAGTLTYTPDPGYLGPDFMTVAVTDQGGLRGSVTIPATVAERVFMPGGVATQFYPDTDGIDTDGDGRIDNDHVMVHLGAGDGFVKMADGALACIFGVSDLTGVPSDKVMIDGTLKAELPGPTLRFRQGQRVYLNLTNLGLTMRPDLALAHAFRVHGLSQLPPVFGGMPAAGTAVKMGGTFAYCYQLDAPGTYLYSCPAQAAEHARMGLAGSLVVTPLQDGRRIEYPRGSGRFYTRFAYNDGDGSTGYDLDLPLQIAAFDPAFHEAVLDGQPLPSAPRRDQYPLLNGRGYPDTVTSGSLPALEESLGRPSQKLSSRVELKQGRRLLLRISNAGSARPYTLESVGLPLLVVGMNARILRDATGGNLYYSTHSLTLGCGESVDAILDTAGIPPGTYFLMTSNLDALSNNTEDFGGMMTEFIIK